MKTFSVRCVVRDTVAISIGVGITMLIFIISFAVYVYR